MLLTSGMRNETERENARTLWASEETEAPSSKGLSQGQTQAVSSRSKMWTPLDFNYNCPALPSSSLQNPGRTRSQSQPQKRPRPLLRSSVQNKGTVCFSKSVRTYGRYCFSIKLSTIVVKLSGDWPEHPHEFLLMGPLCIETERQMVLNANFRRCLSFVTVLGCTVSSSNSHPSQTDFIWKLGLCRCN